MPYNRSQELLDAIRRTERIAIILHDNPDPDAISSALALSMVAESVNVRTRLVARGVVGFEENQLLASALDLEIDMVEEEFHPVQGEEVALVDNAIPGDNNPLPSGIVPLIIIDHHSPPEKERLPGDGAGSAFVEIDDGRASTSSLMVDHLRDLNIQPSPELASGLIYGMMVDTRRFMVGMTQSDYENLEHLQKICNRDLMEDLESPPLDADTLDVLGRAIQNREVKKGFVLSCVDYIANQDSLARASELLLRQKGVHTSMIYGILDDRIYASARTKNRNIHLGDVLREAFQDIGFAGGHKHSAGARLPLGILGFADRDVQEERRTIAAITKRAVAERFMEAVNNSPENNISEED